MKLSSHLNLEDSATVSINSQILEKKARGERIFNLSAGEPVLPTHPAIVESVQRAIADGKTGYPPSGGIGELRRAAAEWLNAWYQTQYTQAQTLVTPGGKYGIFAACHALLEEGDEVIILSPYWVSYPSIVSLFGGVPRIVETKETEGWQPSLDAITAAVTAKTKLVILNSGVNPTGTVYQKEFLRSLLSFAHERGIVVLSDEVYSGLTYEGDFVSCGTFWEYRDSLIVINSCSKNFAMTGWRVGFVFAPENVINVLTKLQSQSTSGTSTISQHAALGALTHAHEVNAYVLTEMRKRRDLFVSGLQALLPDAQISSPQAGLYSFVSTRAFGSETSSSVVCERLLREACVAAIPGSSFGNDTYIRFAFGEQEENLAAALQSIKKTL